MNSLWLLWGPTFSDAALPCLRQTDRLPGVSLSQRTPTVSFLRQCSCSSYCYDPFSLWPQFLPLGQFLLLHWSLHPLYICTLLSLQLCRSHLRCSTAFHKTAIDLAQNHLTCCLLINVPYCRSHWLQYSNKGPWHLSKTSFSVADNPLLALKYFVPCAEEKDFQMFENMGRSNIIFFL